MSYELSGYTPGDPKDLQIVRGKCPEEKTNKTKKRVHTCTCGIGCTPLPCLQALEGVISDAESLEAAVDQRIIGPHPGHEGRGSHGALQLCLPQVYKSLVIQVIEGREAAPPHWKQNHGCIRCTKQNPMIHTEQNHGSIRHTKTKPWFC